MASLASRGSAGSGGPDRGIRWSVQPAGRSRSTLRVRAERPTVAGGDDVRPLRSESTEARLGPGQPTGCWSAGAGRRSPGASGPRSERGTVGAWVQARPSRAPVGGPVRVGRDDGDRPESLAGLQRRGPLPRPVVLRQGPGRRSTSADARRGRRQGAGDRQVPGPAPAPRRQAARLVHLPVLQPAGRAVQAPLGDDPAGRRAGPAPGRRRSARCGWSATCRAGRAPGGGRRPGPGVGRAGPRPTGLGGERCPESPRARGQGPSAGPGRVGPRPPARAGHARGARAGDAGSRAAARPAGTTGRGAQGGQPQRQAAPGLRPRRAGDAHPEPGRHRPGPPPAAARRRLGPAQALVARAGAAARRSTTPRTASSWRCSTRRTGGPAGAAGRDGNGRRRAGAVGRPIGLGTRRFVLRPGPGGRWSSGWPGRGRLRLRRTEGEDDPPTMRWDDGPPWRFCARHPPRAGRQALGLARLAPPRRRPSRPDGPGRAAGPPARPADPGGRPRRPVRRRRASCPGSSGSATRRRSSSPSPSRT